MKQSLVSVLFAVLVTGPIFSTARAKNSSSVIPSVSMLSSAGLASYGDAILSSTWRSRTVIASLSLMRSISIAFPEPDTLSVILFWSSALSTLMLSAYRTRILLSSVRVASAYSTISTSASPFSTLSFIILIKLLVLSNSSMKLMSRICLRLMSCSIAVQKKIGAAFLKFCQNSESSHSFSKLAIALWSGTAEY